MRKLCMKTIPVLVLAGIFALLACRPASAQPLEDAPPITLSAPSCLLMEAQTGTVIFQKGADIRRPVASVTKLMTMLLLLEDIAAGKLSLEDQVTVSQTAASVQGSTALLDAGASYPLADLLRATVVASGNDSAVALAEHAAGSEMAFVGRMNERAAALGLDNTCFVNCTGLPMEGQYTCALDVAAISREIALHPEYFQWSKLWLSSLTHPSGRVTDLTNTNRLVRFYTDCDGFKTGSTNEAKYCISATALRNDMRLIAVVLGASGSQLRFDEARAMLDYGFATYKRVEVINAGERTGATVPVTRGARDTADVAVGKGLSMLLKSGQAERLQVELELPESVQAPMAAGTEIGKVRVLLDGTAVAELPAVLASDVRLPGLFEGFLRILDRWR